MRGATPGDALEIVQLLPADGAATLKEYANDFFATAAGEAPDGVVSQRKLTELVPLEDWSLAKETFSLRCSVRWCPTLAATTSATLQTSAAWCSTRRGGGLGEG